MNLDKKKTANASKKAKAASMKELKNRYADITDYTIKPTRTSRMNAWELLKEWNKFIKKQEELRNGTERND